MQNVIHANMYHIYITINMYKIETNISTMYTCTWLNASVFVCAIKIIQITLQRIIILILPLQKLKNMIIIKTIAQLHTSISLMIYIFNNR